MTTTRRQFLATSIALALNALHCVRAQDPSTKIEVLVWDERQPTQQQAYSNYLGNEIATHLKRESNLSVHSAALDDPNQGLSPDLLDRCRVLIWWGHIRNSEIAPQKGREIVARIKAGKLSLIALQSAHWSTPFVEAMYERSRLDLEAALGPQTTSHKMKLREFPPPNRYTVPNRTAALTPSTAQVIGNDGLTETILRLPYCCFPAYRPDGKPSQITVLLPQHPIAAGIANRFTIDQTEMYDEPFHVPKPDSVILEERWPTGEHFRSGMVWTLGKGRVFYFRPGHETYPVYKNPTCLKILTNAINWLSTAS